MDRLFQTPTGKSSVNTSGKGYSLLPWEGQFQTPTGKSSVNTNTTEEETELQEFMFQTPTGKSSVNTKLSSRTQLRFCWVSNPYGEIEC